MMRFILSTLLLMVSLPGLAQVEATVSGRIVAADTGRPLPAATVTVIVAATEQDAGAVLTDAAGRFVIAGLPEGAFVVRSEFVGFGAEDTVLLVGRLNDVYDLGDIPLAPIGEGLEEVIVTARQQALGATLDRRVFSLADNPVGQSGSLLDALRGVPGVTVDQDGQVLLRGSDRVSVLIDGKFSSLTGFGNQSGLDSVPAANIESIEIINNPSAAFDAAGMAGIINIVYRQDVEQGLNLEVGLTAASGTLSKRRDDLPTDLGSFSHNQKLIPSLNLSFNAPDKRYFLQGEFLLQDDIPNNEFTSRFYDDGRVVFSQVPENREQKQYVISGGMDRILDDQRNFTVSAVIDFETHTDIAQVPFIDQATMTRNRFWFWREKEDTGFFNVNLDYEREFDQPGRGLSMSLQYIRGWEDEAYFLNEISTVRVGTDMTHLDAEENTLPFQIDYVRPLSSGRLETGGRLQRRWIPVSYTVQRGVGSVIYQGLGDWSEWTEEIYAGYVNYVFESERYGVEAGVRVEQADVSYDLPPENIYYDQSDAYDYFELYPNIRLSRRLSDVNSLALYYNNRVDRPGEPELRVFPKYEDPELLKVGNPYLRPQFTETYEFSFEHLWPTGSAIVSAYYRDIEDPFTRVFAIDPTNTDYDIVNRVYQNVGSGSNTGIELVVAQDINASWELTGSLNWYRNEIDADIATLLFPIERPFVVAQSEDDTWDVSLNNLVRFSNGMQLQLSLSYYGERNIAQGIQAARSSVDLGLTRPILDGRGEVVFAITDLFNDFGIRQNILGAGFVAVYENYYETQVASIGINYEFR